MAYPSSAHAAAERRGTRGYRSSTAKGRRIENHLFRKRRDAGLIHKLPVKATAGGRRKEVQRGKRAVPIRPWARCQVAAPRRTPAQSRTKEC